MGGMRGGALVLPLQTLRDSFDFYGFLSATRSVLETRCQIVTTMGELLPRGFFAGPCARS